ncbi:uncharacterized protein FFE2_08600 [Fusarium fujikuroi]|nr:uncharacterized protein FFE2_08600 [Fusarium fujikuroi]
MSRREDGHISRDASLQTMRDHWQVTVSSPSRPSTKACCCIDRDRPKMHSYSLASIHHDEVDSLEDPSSSDGAVDIDSSHHLEAALHEVMEKEKSSVQFETSPWTKPARFTPHACPSPAFSLTWHHRLSLDLQTAGVTQAGTTAYPGRHDYAVNSLFFHLRSDLRSPNLLTIAIDLTPSNELPSGRWDATGSAHALSNSCHPKCNHVVDKVKFEQDYPSKWRPIHDSRSTFRGAAPSRQSSLNRLRLHSPPMTKFLKGFPLDWSHEINPATNA